MRKLLVLIIFCFLLLPNLGRVSAQVAVPPPPGPPPGAPWVEVSHCGPGQIRPDDIRGKIFGKDKTKMIEVLNKARACLTTQNIEIGTIKSNNMAYCDLSQGLTIPYNKDMSKRLRIGKKCCPISYPITRTLTSTCCPVGYQPNWIGTLCESVNGNATTPDKSDSLPSIDKDFNAGPPVVGGSGPVYECPQLGCLTNINSDIIPNNTDKNPLLSNVTD